MDEQIRYLWMMHRQAVERLNQLPRAGLGHWPTPLHRLGRLSDRLGSDIWIKRDDVQGVAFAGNKIRKFDLALGRAVADGYDTLVTTGAVQSNSARTGAAAAAAVGMDCVLLLSGAPETRPSANHLLGHLLGADVRVVQDTSWADLNRSVKAVVGELSAAGRRAFAAPVGCSSPLGALGFAVAFMELDRQLTALGLDPAAIVHTTTSGGTHAGLLVGRAMTGRRIRIIGIDAAGMYSDNTAVLNLAQEAAQQIGLVLGLSASELEISSNQLGEAYGVPTSAGTEAIELLARTEGILTDPVYSGKGLAGAIELVRDDELGGPVVYWHTGGYHALFDPRYGAATVSGPSTGRA